MKQKHNKLQDVILEHVTDYIEQNDLAEISDRRFTAILGLANTALQIEKKQLPSGVDDSRNTDVSDFLQGIAEKAKEKKSK